MPNCFQLKSKATDQAEAFDKIDEAICKHLGVEPHSKYYVSGWYDSIGLVVACGKSFDDCIRIFAEDDDLRRIAVFLNENYTSDAWYESKGRME